MATNKDIYRNEAAERLLEASSSVDQSDESLPDLLDKALATEHSAGYAEGVAASTRLTVERVREAIDGLPGQYVSDHDLGWMVRRESIDSILDDLATADVDEEAGK